MVNKTYNGSTSITIRETQIETTMRYYLTPSKIAVIKQNKIKQQQQKDDTCREIWTHAHHWWECKIVHPL